MLGEYTFQRYCSHSSTKIERMQWHLASIGITWRTSMCSSPVAKMLLSCRRVKAHLFLLQGSGNKDPGGNYACPCLLPLPGGVYFQNPWAGILHPPSLIYPPTPRRVFSRNEGWGCMEFGIAEEQHKLQLFGSDVPNLTRGCLSVKKLLSIT